MIYLLRHGAVPANDKGVLISRTDEPLSALGLDQAAHAAEELRQCGVSFDRVISSPMTRAIQTAEAIAPGLPIEVDERLREVDFGSLEQSFCVNVNHAFAETGASRAVDGENLQHLCGRVRSFLCEVLKTEKHDQNILCVSHGTTIRAIQAVLRDIPPEELFTIPGPQNCGYLIIQTQKTGFGFEVVAENNVSGKLNT